MFFVVQTLGPDLSGRSEDGPRGPGWINHWTQGKNQTICFRFCILTSSTVLVPFLVAVGLRVMSCTNQLGCLMQWQQHFDPIPPEDAQSAQGPSDSTRHLSHSSCYMFVITRIVSDGCYFSTSRCIQDLNPGGFYRLVSSLPQKTSPPLLPACRTGWRVCPMRLVSTHF